MIYALESRKNDCRNCYKCIRGCPVKSISFSDNQASIIHDDCVLCGHCFLLCPQSCKEIRNDVNKVKTLLRSGKKVIVSLAPSYVSAYLNVSFDELRENLIKLGFYDVEETAIGATIVKKVYDEMVNSNDRDVIISTCCHSINLLIQKHYPDLIPCLADVLSPMLAHGKDIKERYPDAYVVFIGPCIAKKDEVDSDKNHFVDAVLTFIELNEWLKGERLELTEDGGTKELTKSKARLFPTTGGILNTMEKSNPDYDYLAIDGMANVMEALEDIRQGKVHRCFIEMSACAGSCINGPAIEGNARSLLTGYLKVHKVAGKEDFNVKNNGYKDIVTKFSSTGVSKARPSDIDIQKELLEMGKYTKQDELNCGSCGYDSCRDKAIAILEGKAVKEMCLPFLMQKAQSFSDKVIFNVPNGLMALDENLNIQLINPAMRKIVGVTHAREVIGKNVSTILDPGMFAMALAGEQIHNRREYLSEYDKYVEATVVFDEKYHVIISIFRDISDEQKKVLKKEEFVNKSVDIADAVIEKNMRVVQEIASLLGESAAETKIALSSLKDTIKNDGE